MVKGKSSAGGASRDERAASFTSPFTEAHAIVFADFGVSVRDGFTRTQYEAMQTALETSLLEAEFKLQPSEDGDQVAGLIYERMTPDGEVAEAFHLHEDHVHVMIHEYRGWQVTRDIALRRLKPIFELFREDSFGEVGARLVLGYRDAFINTQPRRYSPLDVFKPNMYLPILAFDAGDFWQHQLTTVVEAKKSERWKRIFDRITVDARVTNMADDGEKADFVHWTEITHRQQLVGNSKQGAAVEWVTDLVVARFNAMHKRNKKMMVELLNHQMADRIGLLEKAQ